MDTKLVSLGEVTATEIITDEILIKTAQDALDIMASSPSRHIIVHEYNFGKDFFDLSTRIAGEILQKFTNYQVRLAIVGDYSKFKSKSLQDFIYESNKNGEYLFVNTVEQAITIWKKNMQ
ncbi:MAG: DUF4180 domain-containing protein [Candidatus Roizmanbacteria bacterium]|nr:DUF4180 domain-containing protein [Candidatus Roizmanbacteria bacterium]